MEQRYRDPGSGASDGMAERDGASVDVEFLSIEMQFPIAGQYLGREGFIEFKQIEIAEFKAMLPLHLMDSRHRANAHQPGIDAGRGDEAD